MTCEWLRIPAAFIHVVNHLLNDLLTHSSRHGSQSATHPSLDSAVDSIAIATGTGTVQHRAGFLYDTAVDPRS